ncbi:MAG: MFS transporter [Proteobacteria bacterium]|nr:MFS transporter [Pseudomonadota bacterium]MBI3499232.1 MFS transporter [Pseudomonadota bacterium]
MTTIEERDIGKVFFGWKVVAAAFAVAAYGWGLGFYGPSVFLYALHESRGWPVSVISMAITAHYIVGAGIIAYLSDIHRRLGLVWTTRLGGAALALGMLAWSLAAAPWQLFAAILLTSMGWAATSGAAINAIVAPWFEARRAAALGHALNGASFGGLVLAPVWMLLINRLGLVPATLTMVLPLLLALWWLSGRYLGRTPEALGLAPDGKDSSLHSSQRSQPTPKPALLTRAQLLRMPRFLTMSGTFALGLFAQVGLAAHLVTLLAPRLGEAGAAASLSLITGCGIGGRLLLGELIGAADRRLVTAANLFVQACGVSLVAAADGAPMVVAGCILFGLGFGNLVTLPPLMAQAEYERAQVQRVVALLTAINQAVFAFAPGTFGVLRDWTGGYTAPLVLAVSLQLAGVLLVLAGRRHLHMKL